MSDFTDFEREIDAIGERFVADRDRVLNAKWAWRSMQGLQLDWLETGDDVEIGLITYSRDDSVPVDVREIRAEVTPQKFLHVINDSERSESWERHTITFSSSGQEKPVDGLLIPGKKAIIEFIVPQFGNQERIREMLYAVYGRIAVNYVQIFPIEV